jgi:hypothetical protein
MILEWIVGRGWSVVIWWALALGLAVGAYASVCPVMMVSGVVEGNDLVVTFRNVGKLPIRRLEFACTAGRRAGVCREGNALFYPGMEYTVRYPYPGNGRDVVTVAVKAVTMSTGFVWKPAKKQPCRGLRIAATKQR